MRITWQAYHVIDEKTRKEEVQIGEHKNFKEMFMQVVTPAIKGL